MANRKAYVRAGNESAEKGLRRGVCGLDYTFANHQGRLIDRVENGVWEGIGGGHGADA